MSALGQKRPFSERPLCAKRSFSPTQPYGLLLVAQGVNGVGVGDTQRVDENRDPGDG